MPVSCVSCAKESRLNISDITVVEKDKSMESMIDNGEEWMEPLLEFRDWLKEIRDPEKGHAIQVMRPCSFCPPLSINHRPAMFSCQNKASCLAHHYFLSAEIGCSKNHGDFCHIHQR